MAKNSPVDPQEKLTKFIKDPKTIAKAVEGSMDKRAARLEAPISKLEFKLVVLAENLMRDIKMPILLTPKQHETITKALLQINAHIEKKCRLAKIDELKYHKNLLLSNIVAYKDMTTSEIIDVLEDRIKELKKGV